MDTLEGCDDRALYLDDSKLSALRWGAEQTAVPLSMLSPGKVVRHDKGKVLGVFGKPEERVRLDFGRLDLAVWIPVERQDEAEAFVAKVNAAITAAQGFGGVSPGE